MKLELELELALELELELELALELELELTGIYVVKSVEEKLSFSSFRIFF